MREPAVEIPSSMTMRLHSVRFCAMHLHLHFRPDKERYSCDLFYDSFRLLSQQLEKRGQKEICYTKWMVRNIKKVCKMCFLSGMTKKFLIVFVTWCGKFSTLAKDILWEWDLLCDFNRTFCSEFDTRKFFLMPLMSELMIVQHTKHQQQCVHFSSLSPSCTSNWTKHSLPKTKSCTNNN